MSRYWSALVRQLKPYVPGEQPRIPDLVKLNTNENPYGPSPRAIAAIAAAASDDLRLYPDPEASGLREALARHHGVRPEQVFVGNGSDEVLAHAFAALLKHERPLLFPDITGESLWPLNPALAFSGLGLASRIPMLHRLPVAKAITALRPLLQARSAKARLRTTRYRGVDTATMVYDQLPINDVFRKLSDDAVLGAMDLRGIARPYFFVLRRDNSLRLSR